jgi:hypothetical protein
MLLGPLFLAKRNMRTTQSKHRRHANVLLKKREKKGVGAMNTFVLGPDSME